MSEIIIITLIICVTVISCVAIATNFVGKVITAAAVAEKDKKTKEKE